MVQFLCPYCEAPVDPGDAYVAAQARCKQCGAPISLPGGLGGAIPRRPPDRLEFDEAAEDRADIRARVVRDLGVDNPGENLVGVHYLYEQLIRDYAAGADREPDTLLLAIEACRQQISIAARVAPALRAEQPAVPLPPHAGYEQLALIRERQHLYEETVLLAEQAAAEGWAGPWEQLVARCKKTTIQRKPKAP